MDWQSEAGFAELQALVEEPRLGLVTALDGTICPVADDLDSVRVSPRCRSLLEGLSAQLPLVGVISARPASDIRLRVGLPNLVYVGNRGLEVWQAGRMEVAPEAAAFRQALEAAISALYSHAQLDPRLHLEDAGSAIMVHYYRSSNIVELRSLIQEIADQQGLRVFEGSTSFELRPPMLVDKGTALVRLAEKYSLSAVIYAGDDMADVDAFRAIRDLRNTGTTRGLAIGVVAPMMPDAVRQQADLLVEGVPGFEALLGWLLEARSRWIRMREQTKARQRAG